jgi:tRNA(Ile)-lysidine synthase
MNSINDTEGTGAALRSRVQTALRGLEVCDQSVLVAVSGGVDSSVLLHILAHSAKEFGLEVIVGHVNHGLRGDESEADARAVTAMAQAFELRCFVESVEPRDRIQGHSSRTRPTLQEAARELRYDALRSIAERVGAQRIATAHNLDDQLETVLMRLFRGCAPDAMGGIPESSRDGSVVRPFLEISRNEILAYAEEVGCEWREDSSNSGDAYTRNRLRNRWIPNLIDDFNPQLARAVGQLAEAHRRDAEWLGGLVEAESEKAFSRLDPDTLAIAKDGWREMPEGLARRLVGQAFRELGGGRDLTRLHLMRTLAFLREGPGAASGRVLELPGRLRLIRERKRLILRRIRVIDAATC